MVDGVLTETRRTCTDTRVYRVDDYVSGPGAERRVRETCRRVWELSGGQMRLVREQCDQTERTQTPREYRTHRQSYRSGRQERCTLSLKK